MSDAGAIFQTGIKRLIDADGRGFVGTVQIETGDLNMRAKSDDFIGDGAFESHGNGHRKDHHRKPERHADDGQFDDRPGKIGFVFG